MLQFHSCLLSLNPLELYPYFGATGQVGYIDDYITDGEYVLLGEDGVPASYTKVINAKATAYCIPGGITSTGKRAQTGYIAVDPKEIPYGTEMYIVSADGRYVYGYCIAADTGSYIYDVDWTVDLFMNSEAQCVNWGRRDIIIYVL